MKKAAIKRMFTTVLACLLLMACLLPGEVYAATNKALAVPYSFKNLTWEKDGEKMEQNAYITVLPATEKKVPVKGLKTGAVIYIPKKAVQKNGSGINFWFYVDVIGKGSKYIGNIEPKITLNLENRGGKVKMYGWDEKKQKSVKASLYAALKSGKGKYKNYYIVTIKNVPIADVIMTDNGEEIKITSKTKYAINYGLSVQGVANKTSGTFYIDSMSVTSGSKKIAECTFSKKPTWYDVTNRGKKVKKVKIVEL